MATPLIHSPTNSYENIFEQSSDNSQILPHKEKLPLWRLICLAFGSLGISVCWAVQQAYSVPVFLEFGLSRWLVALVCLAGPISGIVVQPIVGALSDRCRSKLGRRRPFLILGGIFVACSILSFAFSDWFGMYIFNDRGQDPLPSNITPSTNSSEFLLPEITINNDDYVETVEMPFALAIAIISFWIMDFALNAIQGPLKTLLTEAAPASQQKLGNGLFGIMGSAGFVLGGFLGGEIPFMEIKLLDFLPFFGTNLRALVVVAVLILIVSLSVTVVFTKEMTLDEIEAINLNNQTVTPLVNEDKQESQSETSAKVTSYLKKKWQLFIDSTIGAMPVAVKAVFLIEIFAYFAWATTWMSLATWMGESVFNGDPSAPIGSELFENYEQGVRMASLASGLQAMMIIILSFLLPTLLRYCGWRFMYCSCYLLLSVLLISLYWVKSLWLAVAIITITGIPRAASFVIPWAIAGIAIQGRQDGGTILALLNLSACIPQIVAALIGSLILIYTSYAAILVVGGCVAGIGGIMVLFLVKEEYGGEEITIVEENEDNEGTMNCWQKIAKNIPEYAFIKKKNLPEYVD